MMAAASFCETVITVYHCTQHCISDDQNFELHLLEIFRDGVYEHQNHRPLCQYQLWEMR
jgi:hypothetical protein